MPIQGLQFTILSSQEAHQSYQATGSFVVYNPNDGVAFIATDRTATGLTWDYKVPSQSGGKFPGPINSYLSVFYLDQSGSGGSGQIVVYASPEYVAIPYFWSIGRALQGQVTSMDVVQGSQPGNPGAGIARLWVDPSGHLHILDSTGLDRTVIDSLNWGTIPLGGDLYGTTGNGHVGLLNNSVIGAYDASSIFRPLFGLMVDNNVTMWNSGGGVIRFLSQNALVETGRLDNTGTFSVPNQVNAATFNAVNNYYYFANNPAIFVQWDGTSFIRFSHSIWVNGGTIYLANNAGIYWTWDGAHITTVQAVMAPYFMATASLYFMGTSGTYYLTLNGNILQAASMNILSWGWVGLSGNPAIYISWDGVGINHTHQIRGPSLFVSGAIASQGWASGYTNSLGDTTAINNRLYTWTSIQAMRSWADLSGNSNAFLAPNIADNRGQGLAWEWSTWASVDHARLYDLKVAPVLDPLRVVRSIQGYYYDHISLKGGFNSEPYYNEDGSIESHPAYGFSASEVAEYLPELVSYSPEGIPEAIDMGRMVVILWEAVKQLYGRFPN
jgi:hypothetical protein